MNTRCQYLLADHHPTDYPMKHSVICILLMLCALPVSLHGEGGLVQSSVSADSIEKLRSEILAVKDRLSTDTDSICARVFESRNLELISWCLENPALTMSAVRRLYEEPPSPFKNEVVLLLLRAGPAAWFEDNSWENGGAANPRAAQVELYTWILSKYLSSDTLRQYPLWKRENRLKVADLFEKAIGGGTAPKSSPSVSTSPSATPKMETTSTAPMRDASPPVATAIPARLEEHKRKEWPWAIAAAALAVAALCWIFDPR
jgi:hypothetical protein